MVPLVLNFHPALSEVGNIIDSLWSELQGSENLRCIFSEKPMVAFRRPRNLSDILVRAKLTRNRSIKVNGMRKCGKKRCQVCNYVKVCESFEQDGCTY